MSTRTVSIDSRVFGELRGSKKSTSISKGRGSDSDKKSSSSSGVSSRSDLHELISKIESMKNLRQVPIKNLDKKKQQELQDLRSAAMLLRKGKNYGLVVNAIQEYYGQSNDLQAGTVGAFFYGCFMENNDDGCLSCSAFCAGSMPVPPTPGWKDCDKSVAIFSEGQLNVRQVNESSDEILVHVINDDFEGFSESDVRKLKGMGVQKVTISTSSASTGKSTRSVSGTPESLSSKTLHSSEECSDESTPASSSSSQSHKHSEESCAIPCNEGGWGGMAIVAVVVFIILLVIIAAVAYYYFAGSGVAAQTTVVAGPTVTTSSTAGFFGPGYKCM